MTLSVTFESEKVETGATHCRRRPMLPAVPMSNSYFPPFGGLGRNSTSIESGFRPLVSALHMSATALRVVRCWGLRPGGRLLALMFLILTGTPIAAL